MQTVVIVAAPASRPVRYNSIASYVLGGIQFTVGLLCIILNSAGIVKQVSNTYYYFAPGLFFVGHGIWGGLFFIITGAIGLGAGCNKNKCLIITFMVMSILSASLFVVSLISVDALAVSLTSFNDHYYGSYDHTKYEQGKLAAMEIKNLHIGMLILTAIELITAVCSSVLCCHAVCGCCKKSECVIPQAQTQYAMQQGGTQPGPMQYVIQPGGGVPPASVQYVGHQWAPAGSTQYVIQPASNQAVQYVPPPSGVSTSLQYASAAGAPSVPPPYVSQGPGTHNVSSLPGTVNTAYEGVEKE